MNDTTLEDRYDSVVNLFSVRYVWLVLVITLWITLEILLWASWAPHVRVIDENWYGHRFGAARSSSSLRPFHSHRSSASAMINLTCRSHVSPREEAKLRMGAERVSTSHSRRVDRTRYIISDLRFPQSDDLDWTYAIEARELPIDIRWMKRGWRIYICLHPQIEYY